MKTTNAYYLIYFLIITGLLLSCGPDDNPDPCANLEPVTARFIMGERITNSGYEQIDTLVLSDTVLTWSSVEFRAPKGYDRYEWKIGFDERTFTDSVVALRFPDPVSSLPIRLIVQDEPNTTCFPEDDGIDTLTQYLTVVPIDSSVVFGRYQGYLESNPADTFTVSVILEVIQGDNEISFLNINEDCNTTASWLRLSKIAYKSFNFAPDDYFGNGCNDPNGWFTVDSTHQNVTIDFSTRDIDDPVDQRQYFHFIGKRIK